MAIILGCTVVVKCAGFRISREQERNQATSIFRKGFLLQYDEIWKQVNSRNLTLTIPQGLFLREPKAFEEEVIREAVNNAVMHRDYQQEESIFLMQYTDSIEVRSPGGFVEGVSAENILDETRPRNKLLADVLYRCGLVEQFGSGVDLLYRRQLLLGKDLPDYSNTTTSRVILKLESEIRDPEFARYVYRVANEKQKELEVKDLLLLYCMKQGERIKASTVTDTLVKLGLVEKVGYGKWILAKKYYSDMGQRGHYTRKRGLSRQHEKALILQHLRDYPTGSRRSDLMQVLPHYSSGRLYLLLNELRREKKYFLRASGARKPVYGKL